MNKINLQAWEKVKIKTIGDLIDPAKRTVIPFTELQLKYNLADAQYYAYIQLVYYIKEILKKASNLKNSLCLNKTIRLFKKGKCSYSATYKVLIDSNRDKQMTSIIEAWKKEAGYILTTEEVNRSLTIVRQTRAQSDIRRSFQRKRDNPRRP